MTLPPIRRPETNRKMKRERKALARPRLKDDAIWQLFPGCPVHLTKNRRHSMNQTNRQIDKLKHREIEQTN